MQAHLRESGFYPYTDAHKCICDACRFRRSAESDDIYGKKDNKTAEKIVGNCFSFLVICAVVMTAVFYIATPQLLVLFGASSVTLTYALEYARIYIMGSIFIVIVLGMNLFITTQGFAKISMLTTVIGAVINIILDPVLSLYSVLE